MLALGFHEWTGKSAFSSLTEHTHYAKLLALSPPLLPGYELWQAFLTFWRWWGGYFVDRLSPLAWCPGNHRTIWKPDKDVTSQAKLNNSKEADKEESPRDSWVVKAELTCSVFGICTANCVPFFTGCDVFERSMHNILMSREESVSLRSLKYGHM